MIRSQLYRKLRPLSTSQCYPLLLQAWTSLWRLSFYPCPSTKSWRLLPSAASVFATSTPDLENLEPLAPHGGSSFAGRVLPPGHPSTQSWKSHQHRRDDSPCFMPIEHDPALWSHADGLRTLLVASRHIHMYINMAGHALWGLHRLHGLI